MANEDLAAQVLAPFSALQELINSIILFLPSIIAAIIILIIGWILGRVLGRIIAEVLGRIGIDGALRNGHLVAILGLELAAFCTD